MSCRHSSELLCLPVCHGACLLLCHCTEVTPSSYWCDTGPRHMFAVLHCSTTSSLQAHCTLLLFALAAAPFPLHAFPCSDDNRDAVRDKLVPAFLAGVASHHAGCLPAWKSLVERCFQRGLLKLVFATGD